MAVGQCAPLDRGARRPGLCACEGLTGELAVEIFDVWGLRDQPALLIGVNFLQQFSRVSIDYSLKELRFELSRVAGAPVLTA